MWWGRGPTAVDLPPLCSKAEGEHEPSGQTLRVPLLLWSAEEAGPLLSVLSPTTQRFPTHTNTQTTIPEKRKSVGKLRNMTGFNCSLIKVRVFSINAKKMTAL